MFKVGFDLPDVVKDTRKQKKKSQDLGVDDLQNMFDELKPKAAKPAKETKPKAAESKPKPESRSDTRPMKSDKRGKAQVKEGGDVPRELHSSNTSAKASRKEASKEASKANASTKSKSEIKPKSRLEKPESSKSSKSQSLEANVKLEAGNAIKRKAEEAQRPAKKLTPLQLKMQQKLSGARFRWINEQLYTTDSAKAFDIFQKQPEVFKEYHDGFRQQVEQWPENPVISFVQQFQDRLAKPLNAPGGLPGDKASNSITVSDMGCGEAELALRLGEQPKGNRRRPRFEVHSFDMNKANDRITVADIANVPLPNESCHVVVYCLALMGTNLADFINEGIRILKPHGLVWIAEIKSRFEGNDYSEFVQKLKDMGLYHRTTDDSNKMFVKFEFVKLPHKMARAQDTKPEIHLKPCIYKRR